MQSVRELPRSPERSCVRADPAQTAKYYPTQCPTTQIVPTARQHGTFHAPEAHPVMRYVPSDVLIECDRMGAR
jgi:hypothetical protein